MVKQKTYMPRIVDSILQNNLAAMGGVLIEGPKWCGKTTTGLHFSNSALRLDDPKKIESNLEMAYIDPQVLLKGETPRLIDEWQLAPTLWDAARYEIDTRRAQGQFIFTGSSVPLDSNKTIHTGTGRFAWLKMRTMSLYESGDSNGQVSLRDLFHTPKKINGVQKYNLSDIAYLICRGGWPQSLGMKPEIALSISSHYYEGIVKSDIDRADGIAKNNDRVRRLMRSYARNQGGQVPTTTLKQDVISNDSGSISEDTIATYICALKKIFVIEDMPSWNPNLRSKIAIRTSDNRYYSDPSIATAALGIGPDDLLADITTMGLLFETMCVRDLRVYAQSLNGDVFHYRDSKDLECDSVIHLRNGDYGLVEIKIGGEKQINEAVKNLNLFYNKINTDKMNDPKFMMVLTAIGDYAYRREDGIYIVPIGCLKN